MVFKLVRVDAEEPNKIELPLGSHLIGRGKFLNCEDKRVSRNHGNLIITEHYVAIEALHQNPCYTVKKGGQKPQLPQVVRKLCREKLVTGDRFGLLPYSFWYEVLQYTPETDSQATDISLTQEQNESAQIKKELNETTENNQDEIEKTQYNNESNVKSNSDVGFQDDGNSQVLDFDLNETVDNESRSESTSLLDKDHQEQVATTEPSKEAVPETSATANQIDKAENKDTTANVKDEPGSNLDTTENVSDDNVELNAPKSPSPKRGHSPDSDVGAKKIKTEPEDVKPDPLVMAKPEDEAGPSNQQAGGPDPGNDLNEAAPPAPPPRNRERCIYGGDCYRLNPEHKARFSHPRDPDWRDAPRAACCHGEQCRRRNPRPRHEHPAHEHPPHVHPPHVHPPPVPRTKANKCWRRRTASEESEKSDQSDSRELPTNHLIVTGKRARKPLPQQSPGSESEEEDPFQSDGSEDWQPPTDSAETAYSDHLLDF